MQKNWEEEAFGVFPKLTKINIKLNPKYFGFTKLISYLHSLLDVYDPDVTLEMNLKHPELIFYGISQEYLRLRIEQYFFAQLKSIICKKFNISYIQYFSYESIWNVLILNRPLLTA